MSFVRQYRRLFSIFVQEEGGVPLPGFVFTPARQSQRVLADQQLLWRARPSGCEIYYQINPLAADPLLGRISSRVRLSLTIQQSDPNFFARYEPDLTAATGPQIYLDNLTATGAIQPVSQAALSVGAVVQATDAMQVVPAVFRVPVELGGVGTPTQLIVGDQFNPGVVVRAVPISAAPGVTQTRIPIDLSDQPPGPYTLTTDAAGASVKTIYVDNELAGAKTLGLVDLYWETAQDSAPPAGIAYLIRFRKR